MIKIDLKCYTDYATTWYEHESRDANVFQKITDEKKKCSVSKD